MTFDELMSKVLSVLPEAIIDEDHRTGELIVSTGLMMGPDDTVVPFEEK